MKVSYTQRTEALLSFFCQLVAKADGHCPHYIQMPIFTLLAERKVTPEELAAPSAPSVLQILSSALQQQVQGKLLHVLMIPVTALPKWISRKLHTLTAM